MEHVSQSMQKTVKVKAHSGKLISSSQSHRLTGQIRWCEVIVVGKLSQSMVCGTVTSLRSFRRSNDSIPKPRYANLPSLKSCFARESSISNWSSSYSCTAFGGARRLVIGKLASSRPGSEPSHPLPASCSIRESLERPGASNFEQAVLTPRDELLGTGNVSAVLVLAGGQLVSGGVPEFVRRRLDKAFELQQINGRLCKIVCLGGGTPHKPPLLSREGFVIHETSSCVEYLHRRGVEFPFLLKEWSSFDTIGNVYFALTQHVIPLGWRKLAVITSEFHMPRTEIIFNWIFNLRGAGIGIKQCSVAGSTVVDGSSGSQGFVLEYYSVADDCIDDEVLQARLKREMASIQNLTSLVQKVRTLEEFHHWFHFEHKAYNARDQHLFGTETDLEPGILKSY